MDVLCEIARNERRIKSLIKEGKVIKCPICWHNIKNEENKLLEHFNEFHTYNEIVKSYSSFWNEQWKR